MSTVQVFNILKVKYFSQDMPTKLLRILDNEERQGIGQ